MRAAGKTSPDILFPPRDEDAENALNFLPSEYQLRRWDAPIPDVILALRMVRVNRIKMKIRGGGGGAARGASTA